MAKLTGTGKTIATLVVVGLIGGGIFLTKGKNPTPPAPTAPAAVTQQAETPAPAAAPAPAVEAAPVQEVKEAPAPVKKHPVPKHPVKHAAPAKHEHVSRPAPHHTSTNHAVKNSEEEANQKALNALANGSL